MGVFNNFWADNTVNNFSKHLIFCTIPCNLLLWGCESWTICEATLKKLEVFLHRNIRKIPKITTIMVKITNESVRKIFFNTRTIRYQLERRQLTFTGKLVRNSEDQIPTELLTSWCDNKLKPGAPLQNNKKNISQNIRLIVPGTKKDVLLTTWVYLPLNDGYWAHLLRQLGLNPSTRNGTKPNPHLTPSPRLSRRTSSLSTHP